MKNYKNLDEFIEKLEQITKEIQVDNNAIIDGVINPEKYFNLSKEKPRILWILKEPDSPDYIGTNTSWDYQDKLSTKRLLETREYTIPTFKRVLYCSYGILSDFKTSESIPLIYKEEVFSIAEYIAYINVSKMPGESESEDENISKGYERFKEILKKQIDSYSPDIIIFGNTLGYFDKNFFQLNEETKKYIPNENNRVYYETSDRLYINAYHPAVRPKNIGENQYCDDIITIAKNWWKNKKK
ncbi:MAG: hypothetical protein PHT69_07080 [Bacteroidales bacterium]|nr:hypothetical protein [Bacteroidales bacterium]